MDWLEAASFFGSFVIGLVGLVLGQFRIYRSKTIFGWHARAAGLILMLLYPVSAGLDALVASVLSALAPTLSENILYRISGIFGFVALAIMLLAIGYLIIIAPDWETRGGKRSPIRLLSSSQAAQYLNLSEAELMNYVQSGAILMRKGPDGQPLFFYEVLAVFKQHQNEQLRTSAQPSAMPAGDPAPDLDTSITIYTEAIAQSPKNADLYLRRGQLYHRKGYKASAAADFAQALALAPMHPRAEEMRHYMMRWRKISSA